MCLKWHPDKNKNENATEKFKEIHSSYEVLYNDNKRTIYNIEYDNELQKNIKTKKLFYLFPKLFNKLKNLNKQKIKQLFYNLRNKINNKDFIDYINNIKQQFDTINPNNQQKFHTITNYNITLSLEEYYNFTKKEFKIPIITKCYICENNHNNMCKICKGNIYKFK